MQETYANKVVYAGVVAGKKMSAIQITPRQRHYAVLDLLADGKLPQKGFVRQEEITLADFLNSRFGRVYDPEAMRMKPAM